jgi:hypothetical protein
MKRTNCFLRAWLAVIGSAGLWAGMGHAQVLTVQVGSAAPPPAHLVNHGDSWRFRKGTNEPQVDWKIVADGGLDATWASGPGGFGYGDNDDTTLLSDMTTVPYNTVYIRKTFDVLPGTDPSRRVVLTNDWDDGFVAYLDGDELVRSPNVLVTNPVFNSQTALNQNHEAFGGGGAPPTAYDLGSVGELLPPGTHILAVHGLNSDTGSSDFSLITDLTLTGGAQVAGGGPLFAIVTSSQVGLSGTNTYPGAIRVTVNGEPASFNPVTGEWSRLHTLSPGLNSLFVAALDGTGAILASNNRDVLYETTPIPVGGVLNGNNVWDGANGTYRVTSTVIVPAGASLRVTNGAVVLLAAGTSVRATTNGVVSADGTDAQPIIFAPAAGGGTFGDLGAFGANSALTLRHAEVIGGQIRPVNGGNVLMEDSVIRDLTVAGTEVIAGVNGGGLTVRRCYGARFGEMDSSETPVLIEDSLLEYFAVDGLDIKGTNVPLVVRRSTIRYGDPNNGNADGLDFGPGAGTVEGCLIHDFPDKGISLGGAPGTQVRGTVIYNCGSGINVNNSTNCLIGNTTISGCATGLFFRTSGGNLSNLSGTNNIVWGNGVNVTFTGNSSLALSFSDVQGGQPGPGNIDANPLFVDAGAKDFRLLPGSPAIGSGLGGANMGALFPVGGLPPVPKNLAALVTGTNLIQLHWQDDSANEDNFVLERRIGANGAWAPHALVGPNVTGLIDNSADLNVTYFYRVRSANASGQSRYSNLASAIRQEPFVGGVLPGNTTWSPAMGTITVMANLIVPTGVTLTVLPGTMVKMTNNVSIVAEGGVINIAGTAENKVRVMPLNGTTLWGQLSAKFAGASLTVRHADISYGQVTVFTNAVGLLEDSFIHDYRLTGGSLFTTPIILTQFAAPTTVRRCHVREYHETLWRNGVLTIEECLFENIHGDAVDFDAAQPGTVIRWCTFRHGQFGNVDAVDVGPGDIPGSFDVRIENCMMFDFPFDKGVSVGDNNSSRGTIVSNCFIYACLSGVMSKDRCEVSVRNCTIVDNNWGFTNYNKVSPSSPTGGGIITNAYNNILWDNDVTVSLVNGSLLYTDSSDFTSLSPVTGATFGAGMISVDPLFVNPAARDYRLTANSPCLGAGRGGADLGARFPVGAPMAFSHPRIESIRMVGGTPEVQFWVDSEKTYTLQSSPDLSPNSWTRVTNILPGAEPRLETVGHNPGVVGARFYRLVSPALP